jgi:hypothetical protein
MHAFHPGLRERYQKRERLSCGNGNTEDRKNPK